MNVQTPVDDVRELHFDRFSSSESLAKASEQARKRNYQDFLIVDIDIIFHITSELHLLVILFPSCKFLSDLRKFVRITI